MSKNNYRQYGKLSAGLDEAYNFGLERYNDLLREAEADRRFAPELQAQAAERMSVLQSVRHFLASLL